MSGEPGQGLPSASADAQQETVTQGLPQHPGDPAHVLGRVQEEDQGHAGRVYLVVLFQIVLQRFY